MDEPDLRWLTATCSSDFQRRVLWKIAVDRAWAKMTPVQQRLCFRLLKGYTIQDAASELALPVESLATHRRVVRQLIRNEYQQLNGLERTWFGHGC